MGVIAKLSATGASFDSTSSLLTHLQDLKNNPKDSIAIAQVNADLQNLTAAASSVIPGVGASTAFVALSADITLILIKAANGVAPNPSDLLAVAGNLVTIVGQVVTAAGAAEIVITGGVGVLPGAGAITLGTGIDLASATVTAASLGVDYKDIKSTLNALTTEFQSLSSITNLGANSGLIPKLSTSGAVTGFSAQNSVAPTLAQDPVVAPITLGTPARNSANFITIGSSNTATIKNGGTLSDLWLLQKNSPTGFVNPNDFYAAVLANNPQISDVNKISAGTTLNIPFKLSDGSITYNYQGGVSINQNASTGEYHIVVPNSDGFGGSTSFDRISESNGGFTVSQVTVNGLGVVTSGCTSRQAAVDGDLLNTTSYSLATGGNYDYTTAVGGHLIGYTSSIVPSDGSVQLGNIKSVDGVEMSFGTSAVLADSGITLKKIMDGTNQITVSTDGSTFNVLDAAGQLQAKVTTGLLNNNITLTNFSNISDSNIQVVKNYDASGNLIDTSVISQTVDNTLGSPTFGQHLANQ